MEFVGRPGGIDNAGVGDFEREQVSFVFFFFFSVDSRWPLVV